MAGDYGLHHSAVAVTLLETPEGESVLFEVRSEKIAHQPGDICCPGGMVEEGETPEEAVIREMTEELLVKREQITVLQAMDILPAGSMAVHPYVCRLRDYDGGFSREEAAEVFCVPLAFFLETEPEMHEVTWNVQFGEDFPFGKIRGGRDYPWRERKDRIFFYEYQGRVIWGLTAKLMKAYAERVKRQAE